MPTTASEKIFPQTQKTSISTVSISGNLRRKLAAIASAGFDGVEIFEPDLITQEMSPRAVAKLASDLGLEITLFQPFRDFEMLPEPHRSRAFDRAERKFDLMEELGTKLVMVCSSVHPLALGGLDRAAEDFHELGERAASRNFRIGYEALAWGRHVFDHRDAWEIVRRTNHPAVGLLLDSFHSLARRIEPDTIRSIPGDKIFHVQFADAPMLHMDFTYWSRHFRNMPGEGEFPLVDFARAVLATGYSGPVSLEIFNDRFRSGNSEALAQDGYRALIQLMDEVRQIEPDLRQRLPALPRRAVAKDFSFIEFATSPSDERALTGMLKTLGFAQTGRHVSKKVTLWQQSDIRIVVNTEENSSARTSYISHGTGISDIGLHVDDSGNAIDRAVALGATRMDRSLGNGEFCIPAIRCTGGSIVHFFDHESDLSRFWEAEFGHDASSSPPGAGLKRIDHIAQTTGYEEMLSWTLFYTSIFDMEKTPMQDVVDPDGLVRSQALKSSDGRIRVTLNGSETNSTLAGRFLADSFGSSVQHVAFATDDIFESAEAMQALGFSSLPISENYYVDLVARFPLADLDIALMRRLNILYDEDEKGCFFQFYGRPWGNGTFFEIVERRDGYACYGAPNAPFRIAAQKNLLYSGLTSSR